MRLAEREPTMEEIVVALRETRRGAGQASPFTVVGGQPGGNRAKGTAADAQNGTAGSTDIADLRDAEIERLLAENARLNERIMFLLKVIEREQTRTGERTSADAAIETDHDSIFRGLRAALEAELRPVMLVLLRMLEKQRTDPAGEDTSRPGRKAPRPAMPPAPYDADGIVDLDAQS